MTTSFSGRNSIELLEHRNLLSFTPDIAGWDGETVAYTLPTSGGKSVVVGTMYDSRPEPTVRRAVFVARLNRSGTGLDSTFGTAGAITLETNSSQVGLEEFQPDNSIRAAFIRPSGSVLVVPANFNIFQVNNRGQLDPNFGTDGLASFGLKNLIHSSRYSSLEESRSLFDARLRPDGSLEALVVEEGELQNFNTGSSSRQGGVGVLVLPASGRSHRITLLLE
jgi:hypothetical protein